MNDSIVTPDKPYTCLGCGTEESSILTFWLIDGAPNCSNCYAIFLTDKMIRLKAELKAAIDLGESNALKFARSLKAAADHTKMLTDEIRRLKGDHVE